MSFQPGHFAPEAPDNRLHVTLVTAVAEPSRRTRNMAATLSESGCAVTLIVAPGAAPAPIPGVTMVAATEPDVPLEYSAAFLPGQLQRDWSDLFPQHAACLSTALAHPAAVIIAQDLPALAAGAIAAMCYDAYLMYDVTEQYAAGRQLAPQHQYELRAAEQVLLSFTDQVTTNSITQASALRARYGIPRPEVILDAPRGIQHDATQRAHLGIGPDRLLLAYHGPPGDAPYLVEVLKAVHRLSMPHLVVIVPGSYEQDASVQACLQQTGLANQVGFFAGDVGGVLAATDGVLVPGSSNPVASYSASGYLLDAVAAGVPVLTRPSPEAIRYVRHAGVGCCLPLHEASAIHRALQTLLVHQNPQWPMRAAASRGSLHWADEGMRLLELLRQLSGQHSRAALHGVIREARLLVDTGQHHEAASSIEAVAHLWPEHAEAQQLLTTLRQAA